MSEKHDVTEPLRTHAQVLCRTIGERTFGDGLAEAERYIHETLRSTGLPVERQSFAHAGEEVANLVARAGSGEGDPLIVGAHYDTVPGTEGADDNASAVCVLLELALRLAARPPSCPVQLVAFTLEEAPAFGSPAQGSRVFVERMKAADQRPRGAIVLEMVGYTAATQEYPSILRYAGYPDTGDFIGVVSNAWSFRFARRTTAGFRRNPDLPVESLMVPFNGWLLPDTRLSDHSSFWDAGWPAVMVTDTAFFRNPHYHLPSDRIETLDFAFMNQVLEGAEHAVRTFD